MEGKFIMVRISCAGQEEAAGIAEALLKKRLIACANISAPYDSAYWWKGKLERSREVFLIAKTKLSMFAAVSVEIKRLHSYRIPEIVAIPISAGDEEYLRWLEDSISEGG